MRYSLAFLAAVSLSAQSNSILDYLKLTDTQRSAVYANVGVFNSTFFREDDRVTGLNSTIAAELAKPDRDKAALGAMYTGIEAACRDTNAAGMESYQRNLQLLTADQKGQLDRLIAKLNDQDLLSSALDSHFLGPLESTSASAGAPYYYASFLPSGVPDPSIDLALKLGLTQKQLDQVRAFGAAYFADKKAQDDRISQVETAIDYELAQDTPNSDSINGLYSEISKRNIQMNDRLTQAVADNRSVLTAAQRAIVDALGADANLLAFTSMAQYYFLVPPPQPMPASVPFPATGLGYYYKESEQRLCLGSQAPYVDVPPPTPSPLPDYLKLSDAQAQALQGNLVAYRDALAASEDTVSSFNSGRSGASHVDVELACRVNDGAAQSAYDLNLRMLAEPQRSLLTQLVENQQPYLYQTAVDAHLVNSPDSVEYNVSDGTFHLLSSVLNLTSDQLAKLDVLDGQGSTYVLYIAPAAGLFTAVEAELGKPSPDPTSLGETYSAIADLHTGWLEGIAQTVAAHRAVLTPDQLALLDAVAASASTIDLMQQSAADLLLTATPQYRPASYSFDDKSRSCLHTQAMYDLLNSNYP